MGLAGSVIVVVTQPVSANANQVTAVKLNPTAVGIEIILSTTNNKPLQAFTSSYRKTFIVNLVNTQLQPQARKFYRQENPTASIAAVTVNTLGANSVRIVITGKSQLPLAQVRQSDRSLVLSLTSPVSTAAQQPQPQPQVSQAAPPQNQTVPEKDFTQEKPALAEQDEEIEIVVTGE